MKQVHKYQVIIFLLVFALFTIIRSYFLRLQSPYDQTSLLHLTLITAALGICTLILFFLKPTSVNLQWNRANTALSKTELIGIGFTIIQGIYLGHYLTTGQTLPASIVGLGLLFILSLYRRFNYDITYPALALILTTCSMYRYSAWEQVVIGDEYIFIRSAFGVKEHGVYTMLTNLYNWQYVYDAHPYSSSLWQGLFLRLPGPDLLLWKASSHVTVSLACLFFLYGFRQVFSRSEAFVGAILIGGGQYLLSFGSIGYNNTQALLVSGIMFVCVLKCLQTRSIVWYFFTGLSSGLTFHVFPAAILLIPIPTLILLIHGLHLKTVRRIFAYCAYLIAFLILAGPIMFQAAFWQDKIIGTFLSSESMYVGHYSAMFHLGKNFLHAFFSFLPLAVPSHFVALGFFDLPVAAFTLIGLAYSFTQSKKEEIGILLAYSYTVFVIGAVHGYLEPPATRMFLLLPFFAFFTIRGIKVLFSNLQIKKSDQSGVILSLGALTLIVAMVQNQSINPFYSTRYQQQPSLFVKAIQILKTENQPLIYIISDNKQYFDETLSELLKIYGDGSHRIDPTVYNSNSIPALEQLLNYNNVAIDLRDHGSAYPELTHRNCWLTNSANEKKYRVYFGPDNSQSCEGF